MMSYLWIFLVASLAIGAKAQGDLNLEDFFDGNDAPTPAPAPKDPVVPKEPSDGAGGLDLFDALEPSEPKEPVKPAEEPKAPAGDGFNLDDALLPDPDPVPVPEKPADGLPKDGGNASFDDKDLLDLGDFGNDNNPDGDKGARAVDPNAGSNGDGAEEPKEAGSGQIAGIISAVGVAIVGAASSYFAYQKKKLCFKVQGGDPESANKDSGTQAEPQVMSNLIQSS
ncbi:hypothetical protein AAFF_G00008330 [Aldrovandia affinis]|uniref:CD99 antigen-like protein 2 n=1 Tax=Aldrovandia affinis TaxID=143900 RepID=A0AAD7T6B6_9TELE|nr:hypothetical protein AAFF_G00008330 [Aldrovandia affinis]